MDFVNLSASMTMLELVRFLLQGSNDSFSFYSGKLGNIGLVKENLEINTKMATVCQYVCKKVREVWTVQNLGIIAVNQGELMICVTSPDSSVPAEAINFMVEAMSVCSVILAPDNSRITYDVNNDPIMDVDVSPDLVQVHASMKEINERIDQFIRYKREQANTNNVLDFCGVADGQLCARVNAVLVRKKDSSSHMAVRNVLDRYTAKHNIKKEDKIEQLSSVTKGSQESMVHSRIQSPLLAETSSMKGEKRTFDTVSLESPTLSNVKKQHKIL